MTDRLAEIKRAFDEDTFLYYPDYELYLWLVSEVERLREANVGWVSVEDRTPNDGALVIVADKDGRVMASAYNDEFAGEWHFEQGPSHRDHFTHWRPLPEGPSDE